MSAPVRHDPVQRRVVRMAVQDKLGAVPGHGLLEIADAEQPLVLRHRVADRRMMDHHHAEQALLGRLVEQPAEPLRLVLAEKTRWP